MTIRPVLACVLLLIVSRCTAIANPDSTIFVEKESENLRNSPNGDIIGQISRGTQLQVIEEQGNWVKVTLEGYIWKGSTSSLPEPQIDLTPSSLNPLSLSDFDISLYGVNPNVSRYSKEAHLTLKVKNNTGSRIKAWRCILVVQNVFGDELFKVQLTSGSSNIFPYQTEDAMFVWEDNQFIDDEVYDNLAAYSKENLRLLLTEIQVSN